jgi:phosphoribosylaminoimidazole carboxylase (NCAIR synthetase)
LGGLVPAQDRIVGDGSTREESGPVATFEGRAFCPTPRAIRVLESAGARVVAPSLEALQRVNHRAFSAELGQFLPGAHFVRTWDELHTTLATASGPWVLKRAFGFAGRGRQRLRSNEMEPAVEPFVRASLEFGGGLEVEPWVERVFDVALHGFVSQTGETTLGDPTRVEVDHTGAWVSSTLLAPGVLTPGEEHTLFEEAQRSARALHAAGYFGPFGIDAYRWKPAGGAPRFNPRSEINARYSMGWAVGMRHRRPDLEPQLSAERQVG